MTGRGFPSVRQVTLWDGHWDGHASLVSLTQSACVPINRVQAHSPVRRGEPDPETRRNDERSFRLIVPIRCVLDTLQIFEW